MKRKALRFLSLGGLIAPILFATIILVSASLRSDYNHMHNFVSELGATSTPNEQLMNIVGFMISGLLICSFGISLLFFIPKKLISRIGTLFIMIFGLGMILAGTFSCDPGCPTIGSTEAVIHDKVSAITFISAILGITLLGFSFKKLKFFQNIGLYSILSGIIAAILLITMMSSFESRIYTGLWQRLLLFSIFLWTTVVGIKLYRQYTN